MRRKCRIEREVRVRAEGSIGLKRPTLRPMKTGTFLLPLGIRRRWTGPPGGMVAAAESNSRAPVLDRCAKPNISDGRDSRLDASYGAAGGGCFRPIGEGGKLRSEPKAQHCNPMELPMLKRRHPWSVPLPSRQAERLRASLRLQHEWFFVPLWRLKPLHPPSMI
jgi:hypothetical protein